MKSFKSCKSRNKIRVGQRARFKAFVATRDFNGHVRLGVKCSKEVATTICGAIIWANLSIVSVRKGFWGNPIGKPHIVPSKVTGQCCFILMCHIYAPFWKGYCVFSSAKNASV
ncbi:RP-S2e [Lepeophtheirus salmonis]|uniref:RP-S2e n=1 Tax=Lepeophtheirus salmonis TaxID=72036 RepID=A0A7R8H127_LEPSM|nr:RP-S2e [Lepeophtheirus salmonis]CAF2803352.1 RP-S2e [Lepeophtheirus salmonis]